MKRGVVLRRIAAREYEEAIARYERERVGLGQEFRNVIEQYFRRIADKPEVFPKIRSDVRRAVVLRRFPFVIHFLAETERIVILSVFHTSRNPNQLKYRG
jgi:plasmid stabilization system protein ParE